MSDESQETRREIDIPPMQAGKTLTLTTAYAALWRVDFGVYGSVSANLPLGTRLKITAGPVQPRIFVRGADLEIVDDENIVSFEKVE